MFVAYLWGIETLLLLSSWPASLLFVAYLWGIETRTAEVKPSMALQVCSLPMRDWNRSEHVMPAERQHCL